MGFGLHLSAPRNSGFWIDYMAALSPAISYIWLPKKIWNPLENGLEFTSYNKCSEQSQNKPPPKKGLKESSLYMHSKKKIWIIKEVQCMPYFPIPEALLSKNENMTNIIN